MAMVFQQELKQPHRAMIRQREWNESKERRLRREEMTRYCDVLPALVLILSVFFFSVGAPSLPTASAFSNLAPRPVRSLPPSLSRSLPSSSALHVLPLSWEDAMFHAQTAASSLADLSLHNENNDGHVELLRSFPVMYGAGLLTSLSPCVWGLLPLTMSYISTAAGERRDRAVILPTMAFAAGLASVFCTLGLVAATVGGAVYGNSGNTSILLPLVSNSICCVMGLQLLELVDLPILRPTVSAPPRASSSSSPSTNGGEPELILIDGSGQILQSTSSTSSTASSDEQGSLVRTFLLGGSSALVASPCATPVLTSILAFVANSNDPLVGGVLLLVYTLGYSTPLLLTAATGGQALVKLKGSDQDSFYGKVLAPWVTPLTAGILLWYGTNGLLTTALGDPSLAGLLTLDT